MSAPDKPNPFAKKFVVRLDVSTEGEWFKVDCDMCHRILASGDTDTLGQKLEDVLRRVVTLHRHEV